MPSCAFDFLALALLDDLGLGRSGSGFCGGGLGGGRDLFLHRDDVCDQLIGIGKELDLVRMRQIGHANRLPEDQVADIAFDEAGNIARQTLDLDLAKHEIENAALRLDPHRLAPQLDRHADLQHLIHGDALQIDMQQVALDGLVLPVHDHRLGLLAIQRDVEDGVMPGLGMQNSVDLLGVDGDRPGRLAGAVKDGGIGPVRRRRRAAFLSAAWRGLASTKLAAVDINSVSF